MPAFILIAPRGTADGGSGDGGSSDGGSSDGGTADGGTSDEPCVPPGGATVSYDIHEQPDVVLPGAGESFVDPTFGNTLIQVTDSTTDGPSYHAYSYWPVFNADSSMLHIAKGDVPTLYAFDTDTHRLTERGALFPSGVDCNWETAAWSHTDPDLLYCHSLGTKILYSFDVTAGDSSGLTIIHDFKDDLKGTGSRYLNQMLVDKSDNVFTFHTRDDRGNGMVAIAHERGTDTVYLRDYSAEILDETHVDHDGD